MFLTLSPFCIYPFTCTSKCNHTRAYTHTFLQNTLDCRIICNCEYICFSHREMPAEFDCVLLRVCAHVLCVYLSLGRCPLTWPATGQSLRTLPYCTPHRGLETGHQRLKEEEYRRREEAERAKEGERQSEQRKERERKSER